MGLIGLAEVLMLIMCDGNLTEYMLTDHGQVQEYEK